MAKPDYFIKLDGPNIKGEASADGHKDEIDIHAFDWSEAQEGTGSGAGKGGTAGKVRMEELKVTMLTNKSSPELFLACANGKHFDSLKLTCRKAGETPQDYLTWTLNDVIVTSFQTAGAEVQFDGDVTVHPIDQVSFNFKKIKVEYKPLEGKKLGAAVTAGFDLTTNKKT